MHSLNASDLKRIIKAGKALKANSANIVYGAGYIKWLTRAQTYLEIHAGRDSGIYTNFVAAADAARGTLHYQTCGYVSGLVTILEGILEAVEVPTQTLTEEDVEESFEAMKMPVVSLTVPPDGFDDEKEPATPQLFAVGQKVKMVSRSDVPFNGGTGTVRTVNDRSDKTLYRYEVDGRGVDTFGDLRDFLCWFRGDELKALEEAPGAPFPVGTKVRVRGGVSPYPNVLGTVTVCGGHRYLVNLISTRLTRPTWYGPDELEKV
jgi:hypothetical protein